MSLDTCPACNRRPFAPHNEEHAAFCPMLNADKKAERMKDMHRPLPYWTPSPPTRNRRVKKPKSRCRR